MSGVFPDGTTLETVIDTLANLALAENDGVRYFNHVYIAMTREVARRVATSAFEDKPFMIALDVAFAGLYIEAVRAPQAAPRSWQVVFEKRTEKLAPLRFALAGMNAHINHDLAVALDLACTQLGGALERDSPRCRDFLAINGVIEGLMNTAKAELFSRAERFIDTAMGALDDMFEAWSITAARDHAWSQGAILHHLGPGAKRDAALESLDKTTSLIGRLLLL